MWKILPMNKSSIASDISYELNSIFHWPKSHNDNSIKTYSEGSCVFFYHVLHVSKYDKWNVNTEECIYSFIHLFIYQWNTIIEVKDHPNSKQKPHFHLYICVVNINDILQDKQFYYYSFFLLTVLFLGQCESYLFIL